MSAHNDNGANTKRCSLRVLMMNFTTELNRKLKLYLFKHLFNLTTHFIQTGPESIAGIHCNAGSRTPVIKILLFDH
jgi:hypothetical protein